LTGIPWRSSQNYTGIKELATLILDTWILLMLNFSYDSYPCCLN
jgi:hypothetical protein